MIQFNLLQLRENRSNHDMQLPCQVLVRTVTSHKYLSLQGQICKRAPQGLPLPAIPNLTQKVPKPRTFRPFMCVVSHPYEGLRSTFMTLKPIRNI